MIVTRSGSLAKFTEARRRPDGVVEVRATLADGTLVADGRWLSTAKFRASGVGNELMYAAQRVMVER